MDTIQREEFITIMSKKGGVTKCSCRRYINLMFDTLYDLLQEDKEVNFQGIMKVVPYLYKERETYDISSGDRVHIDDRRNVKVRMSKAFQDKFNKDYCERQKNREE